MIENNEENCPEVMNTKGVGWRVSLSIVVAVGWLVFLIVWLAFFAGTYSWEKNLAIVLLSILILAGILGIPWAIWGLRQAPAEQREMWKVKGFRSRVWVSVIAMLAVFIFLIYWFWFLTETFTDNVYQNIAIFIVAFLVFGGLVGAMWAPWGMKYGSRHHHEDCDCEKK